MLCDELNRVIETKFLFEEAYEIVYYSIRRTWCDDNGNMERVTYPDNAYTAYTYYSNNDLKTVQNVNSSGTTIEAYNYAYDGNRNQTTVLDGYGTTRYEYNALNQLAKVTLYNGQITQYTYDGAGNRSTESVFISAASEPDVTTYSYDGRNLLTATVEEKTILK